MRVIAAEPQAQNLAQRTTELSTSTRIEDTTAQSLQRQAASLQEGQRILRETASSVSGANQQAANAKAEGGNSQGGFLGLVNVGVQLADRAATIKLSQQERELKRQEALKKQQDAETEARRQEQLTLAESAGNDIVLTQRENGTINTLESLREVVGSDKFPDLTAEDKREFERRFQARLREVEDDTFEDTKRSTTELVRAKYKNLEAKFTLDSSAAIAGLRYEQDPTKQNATIQELLENSAVVAAQGELSLTQELALRTTLIEQISKEVGENQESRLLINETRAQLSAATAAIGGIEEAWANGEITSWAQKTEFTSQVMAEYPLAKGYAIPTAEGARDEAIARQTAVQKLRALEKERFEFDNQLPVLENSVIASAALEIIADPSLRVKYEALDTGDNKRILETAEHLESIKKRLGNSNNSKQLAASNEKMVKAQSLLSTIQQFRANPESRTAALAAKMTVPDISDLAVANAEAEYNRARNEYMAVANDIQSDLQELAKFGVAYNDKTNTLGIIQSVADDLNRARETPTTGGEGGGTGRGPNFQGANSITGIPPTGGVGGAFGGIVAPGFNGAGGANGASYQPLSTKGGITGSNGTVKLVPAVASVYRGHFIDDSPVGSYDFTFIDKSDKTQTALPSPVSGVVTEAGVRGGYGNVIAVYDPSTKKEWFMAHLASAPPVQVGQQVLAGQSIGVQGSTGNSTGDHIHLEIYDGKWAEGGPRITNRARTQPLVEAYLNRATSGDWPSTAGNSLGLPPSQSFARTPFLSANVKSYAPTDTAPPPPGAMVLPGGGYILGGVLRLPSYRQVSASTSSTTQSSQFNNNRPLTMPQTSRYREDYPAKNDPDSNYGYQSLREDPPFARALAKVADNLDIPAQWLADIMAFESTQDGKVHNPRAQNSSGAVGLIQFYPGGGLAEVAKGMNVSESEAKRRLLGMSRAQQMPWVENHLRLMLRYAGKEKYERMDDVFAAIFGGVDMLMKSDAERQNVGDGAITYALYRKQIGSHVGRTYSTERGSRPTHTKHHGNCSTCNQMLQTQGRIIAHQAP